MKASKTAWLQLGQELNWPQAEVADFWQTLESHYEGAGRHYHNLTHLGAMLGYLEGWPDVDEQRKTIALAIWFHDLIYLPTRKDNEQKSAQAAQVQLERWGYAETPKVIQLIEATAGHKAQGLGQTGRLFLDLDLSILGRERSVYLEYTQAIRKEYAIFPGFWYRKGRRKVLQHFLERERLFFTEQGQQKWEAQARENLRWELAELSR